MKIVKVEDRRGVPDHLRDDWQCRWKLEILKSTSDPTAPVGFGDQRYPLCELRSYLTPRRGTASQREACSCPSRTILSMRQYLLAFGCNSAAAHQHRRVVSSRPITRMEAADNPSCPSLVRLKGDLNDPKNRVQFIHSRTSSTDLLRLPLQNRRNDTESI